MAKIPAPDGESDTRTRFDRGIPELTGDGDGYGDEIIFPDGDGDGDGKP